MTYSLDVNLLLYASDTGSPNHERARAFVAGLAKRSDILCLAWQTLMSYLRIATHGSIFAHPLSPADAFANVSALLALPRARPIAEAEGFLDFYREVTDGQVVRGNLVPDAHLAAQLRQHGVTILYTADANFRRFAFLDVRNPLTESV